MLMNYLEIPRDTPTRIHATDHYYIDLMIFDKNLGYEKPVKSLTLWVTEVNGAVAALTFSIISEKLAIQLAPYLPDSDFRNYDFIITKTGEGYLTDWTVLAIPRSPEQP